MIAAMGGVGLFAGILIVFTFVFTLPIIEKNKAEYLEKSIFQVIPAATSKQVFFVSQDNTLVPAEDPGAPGFKIFAGYDDAGKLVGVALEASGQGFQDVIRLIYGYSPERECIVGMKVLESKETPGLGDKIEKDEHFVANFKCLDVRLAEDKSSLLHPIELVKAGAKTENWQIDAITGATISSRAVTNILRKSTEQYIPLIVNNLDRLKRKN